MVTYAHEYEKWMASSKLDPVLKTELESISGSEKDKEERFYTELEFGTAGLRGIIGSGTNRMNVHVVRRATKGLADYLLTCKDARERGVAIAYDSRRMSERFALETALVLAGCGIKAYLYSTLHSVPQLSFTVRHLGCIAGVVITASHNPPEYNGYKVYWEHGGQAGPEQAAEIYSYIKKEDYFDIPAVSAQEAKQKGLLVMIGGEIDEAYYASTQTLLLHPDVLKSHGSELNIVYTPLHGSGYVPVTTLLRRIGVENLSVVKEQALPDGEFPTVKAPNPEDPAAFELAKALADETGANILIATDPDSDRLGVAVRSAAGDFNVLTGNQIGSLLIHYILTSMKENGTLPENGLVVKSFVSTKMADAICNKFGVQIDTVPTGFRFISEKIDECERTHGHKFIFGFEESYGFLAGTFSRDKDAVCAAMLIAEACAYYAVRNKTLFDVLEDMYAEYGCYTERVKSYTLSGKEGISKIQSAMKKLRAERISEFSGVTVVDFEDMLTRKDKLNVLMYELAEDGWLCIRPSGTEPKLKLYAGAKGADEAEAVAGAGALVAAADEIINRFLK